MSVLLIAATGVQGDDVLPSQVQHSELLLKNAERLKQMRYVSIGHFAPSVLRKLRDYGCISALRGLFLLSRIKLC
jgi:hypothetical protein